MRTQNTFHHLTADFIGAIISNLPKNISSDKMQTWIQNPKTLQRELMKFLAASVTIIDITDPNELRKVGEEIKFKIVKYGDEAFHSQTAKFISSVTQNIPIISNDKMEFWIKNELTLKRELRKALISDFIMIHKDDAASRKQN